MLLRVLRIKRSVSLECCFIARKHRMAKRQHHETAPQTHTLHINIVLGPSYINQTISKVALGFTHDTRICMQVSALLIEVVNNN